MRLGWVVATVLVASLAGSVWADEGAEEREEQTFLFLLEEAYTQHRHELQLTPAVEVTGSHREEAEIEEDGGSVKQAKKTTRVRWPVEAEWGVTDRIEAQVGVSFIHEETVVTPVGTANRDTRDEGDFEDMELGVRYKLIPESMRWPALSVGYSLMLPTGDRREELGAQHTGHEWVALLSRDFGRWVGHLNIGYGIHFNETKGNEDGTKSPTFDLREISYGAAGVYRITEHWKGFLELFHEFGQEIQSNARKAETAFTILPGLSYAGSTRWGGRHDRWEVGLGVPLGLTRDAPDWGVIVQGRYEVQF